MDKFVLIKLNTLKKIKIAIEAQYDLLNKPEVLREIPILKRPILKLEKRILKTMLIDIDEALIDE